MLTHLVLRDVYKYNTYSYDTKEGQRGSDYKKIDDSKTSSLFSRRFLSWIIAYLCFLMSCSSNCKSYRYNKENFTYKFETKVCPHRKSIKKTWIYLCQNHFPTYFRICNSGVPFKVLFLSDLKNVLIIFTMETVAY